MESLCDQDYITFKDFKLTKPLWGSIEHLVECYDERNELKKIIGQSIVDETLDLHVELCTLHEIWQETQEEVPRKSSLPEPPFIRENLEKQITLLVELLNQKLQKKGEGAVSAFLSEDDRKLIKSVSSDQIERRTRCDSSSRSSSQCDTPTSDYYSRCSSSLSIDQESLQDKISVSEIDTIAQTLRYDFEEERKNLLKDITYIQSALIYESDLKTRETQQKQQGSPSIRDLQKLSSKLEKQILQDASKTTAVGNVTTQAANCLRSHPSRKLKPLNISHHHLESNFQTGISHSEDHENNNNNNNDSSQVRFLPSPPVGGKIPTPPTSGRSGRATATHHLKRTTTVQVAR